MFPIQYLITRPHMDEYRKAYACPGAWLHKNMEK
ncbi:hypothetical protein FHS56_001914 [Thermonema lapsum]|uniref:Uncharacterized protein n=1 Tax=Thermonema lapsum TaxID=28195 RepID=A0A846MSJ9_9BACT|nr:hypothetical protein [Thermonema lapsum]